MPDCCDDRDHMDRDVDDHPTWYCRTCSSVTAHHFQPGHRSYMARFAEPDEEWWTCPECGELDADEVTETEPEEDANGR